MLLTKSISQKVLTRADNLTKTRSNRLLQLLKKNLQNTVELAKRHLEYYKLLSWKIVLGKDLS